MKRVIIIIILLFIIYQQNFAQVIVPTSFHSYWSVYEPIEGSGFAVEQCEVEIQLIDAMSLRWKDNMGIDTLNIKRFNYTVEQDEYVLAIALDDEAETRIFMTDNSVLIASSRSSNTILFQSRPLALRYAQKFYK